MKLIDIGCFNGDSVLHFIADPEISSIEAYDPNPRFTELWQAIEKRYPNVKFHQQAVSNTNNKAIFNLMPDNIPLGSTIAQDKIGFNSGEHIEVQTIDVTDIINEPCWLKLDAEGSEFEILERLIETKKIHYVKRLYVEWHTRRMFKNYKEREINILEHLKDVDVRKW